MTAEQRTPKASLSSARLLRIAVPIMLSNATLPLLGAVDTLVIGQMGLAAPIGAVGLGAIILTAVYWIFGFLRMGTTGLVAQAIGANDRTEVRLLLLRGLMIGLTAGCFLILIQKLVFGIGFWAAPASSEVEALALNYMQIRVFSAPAAIASYAMIGWLIAQERTGQISIIQFFTNGVNILLDFTFVLGFDWGIEGVAWASFIAEWLGFILAIILCRDGLSGWSRASRSALFATARLVHIFKVNRDILIRSLLLEAIFVSLLFLSAGLGDVTLAANQVLLQFLHLVAHMLDGFAFAAESLVGQAVGARNANALREAAWRSSIWGLACVATLSLGFYLGGPAIIDLMTTADDVRIAAKEYLWFVVAAPLIGLAGWMYDGIFFGATQTRDMRNMMLISAAFYALAVWLLLPIWGNAGLWSALLISFVMRGITLGFCFPKLLRSI